MYESYKLAIEGYEIVQIEYNSRTRNYNKIFQCKLESSKRLNPIQNGPFWGCP